MNYILEKYGRQPENRQQTQWLWEKTEALERTLFQYLSFAPDELERLIADENGSE